MSIIMLKKKRIAFPHFGIPTAVGETNEGKAWSGRLILDPDDPQIKEIEAAIAEVAKAKWKEDAKDILATINENKRSAFERGPYKSKKTGKVYGGFEGKFNLGTRWSVDKPGRPTVLNKHGEEVDNDTDRDRLIYSGCYVNMKVEFWAQDNSYGRRINCTPLGVMFAADGESFGGGAGAASADDFAEYAASADDLL